MLKTEAESLLSSLSSVVSECTNFYGGNEANVTQELTFCTMTHLNL